ncbi:MAG: glycosyltransferase N-terminal domain-containing protein [Phycisphaerae bacterium]|nr:glycosyltransferase N-terminal domain-containing protein [Phycisphaerae bacterium]
MPFRSRLLSSLLIDSAFGVAAVLTSPVWLWRMGRRGKLRTDWPARFGRVTPPMERTARKRILIHAVSVGEVNAIRLLVQQLAADASAPDVVIATTTDTGFARAKALFAGQHRVVRYPFDFSGAVRRFLDAVRPDCVALVELEVWPNFTAECEARGIPIAVINGRLSARSFRRYERVRPLVAPIFHRLSAVSAQTAEYAERFCALGAAPAGVVVGGTMKWDTAEIADHVPGSDELALAFGIDRTKPIVVAGSTAPGEETLIAQSLPRGVQLIVAPRRPEWFADTAEALAGCARRSTNEHGSATGRFLLDTIGELRMAYALADVVVVGRSFGELHGSDMMEPVALGKPVLIGPSTSDFRETMDLLRAGGGIVEVEAAELPRALARLLATPDERRALADRGREVIRAQQGATRRNAELLLAIITSNSSGTASGQPLNERTAHA